MRAHLHILQAIKIPMSTQGKRLKKITEYKFQFRLKLDQNAV